MPFADILPLFCAKERHAPAICCHFRQRDAAAAIVFRWLMEGQPFDYAAAFILPPLLPLLRCLSFSLPR
jgi:hypothetical protein